MSERKWTVEILSLLYKGLNDKFGSHYTWKSRWNPKKGGGREGLNKYAKDFAVVVKNLTNKPTSTQAVLEQLAFSTAVGDTITAFIPNYFLNMAIAYDVGFIRSKDFPETIL